MVPVVRVVGKLGRTMDNTKQLFMVGNNEGIQWTDWFQGKC